MASFFKFLLILLEVILLFNLIIIVHELGHFLAARWRGLKVEGFGVWFGKPIWKKEINGVMYSLGSIPAGGFVKLPQLAPMDVIEGETDTPRDQLPPISALDKIIVAFAGPLFSMGLAVVLAVGVWWVGKPVTEMEMTTVIGMVEKGSPAEAAGLLPGDKVLEVDGRKPDRFIGMINSVTWYIIRSEGETIPFKILRDGKELTIESGYRIGPSTGRFARKGLRQVGLGPAIPAVIERVEPNTPAAASGLQAGDRISHINGTPIHTPMVLNEVIATAPEAPVELGIKRGDTLLSLSVIPTVLPTEGEKPTPRIGIVWSPGEYVLSHPSPKQQIVDSVSTIWNMLGALFSPNSDVKAQHFSGPVGIGNLYYQLLSNENGWRFALWFSVLFNVNLAVLNMLPLPVLDGGHIVLAIIESIRRRPVNIRILEVVQTACALLIIGYMLYVTFYDVQDLPWRRLIGEGAAPVEQVATPSPEPVP